MKFKSDIINSGIMGFRLFFILSLVLLSSCVVNKRLYDDLLAEKVKVEAELDESEEMLAVAQEQNEKYAEQIEQLQADTAQLSQELERLTMRYDSLYEAHQKLQGYYDNVLSNSGKLSKDLAEQRQQLQEARERLELERLKNEELSSNLEEREKKVSELERILEEKEKAVADLKKRVTDALVGFKDSDLEVSVKNGKVYVSLADKLLFKSFSIQVDEKGKKALRQLADVLNNQKDINILVEGHTDNVPISKTSQYMRDNWDLSVLRANSIVDILTDEGVDPARITAAGRGEYSPVAENTTQEGKSLNRRTEIILTPQLDELFEILEYN